MSTMIRPGLAVWKVVLTGLCLLVAGVVFCGPVRSGVSGKITLREVYSYRLPITPLRYWTVAIPEKPWLVVAAFDRREADRIPYLHLFLVDWQKGALLSSQEIYPTARSLDAIAKEEVSGENCPDIYDKPVAMITGALAVKICASLLVYELPSMELKKTVMDFQPDVEEIDLFSGSPDGRLVAVVVGSAQPRRGPSRKKLVMYEVPSWVSRWEQSLGEAGRTSLSFSHDGRMLAVEGSLLEQSGRKLDLWFTYGHHLRIVDTANGKLLFEFNLQRLPEQEGHHGPPFRFAGTQSQWLLSSKSINLVPNDNLHVWDWRTGEIAKVIANPMVERHLDRELSIKEVPEKWLTRLVGPPGGVGKLLDVSPDGRWVAASVLGEDDRAVLNLPARNFMIWDVETGEVVYESPVYYWLIHWLPKSISAGHESLRNFQQELSFSPDGKYLIDATGYNEVTVYAIEDSK